MSKGVTIWFTGLSGSGKSTIARLVEKKDGLGIGLGLGLGLGLVHDFSAVCPIVYWQQHSCLIRSA